MGCAPINASFKRAEDKAGRCYGEGKNGPKRICVRHALAHTNLRQARVFARTPFPRLEGRRLRAKAAEEAQVGGRRRDGGDKTEQDREEE